MKVLTIVLTLISACYALAQNSIPQITSDFQNISDRFNQYDVVLEPDKNAAEWWAGAPSVVIDKDGTFWMACRMRSPEAPRGNRGYELRILSSKDGIHFKKEKSILRTDVPIPGFERPALLIDPETGMFKLYACGAFKDGIWSIIKFDDAKDPTQFIPSTARAVISPPEKTWERDITIDGYKDPVIIFADGMYHCYVIGYLRRLERIYHYTSKDGESWSPIGHPNNPVLKLTGWHDFFIRPASVLPLGVGYLFIYEGSNSTWYDPVYNVVTGLGFTFDLNNIQDLTIDSPLVMSTTANKFYTLRYSHWMWVNNELWVYAEAARKNHSHEIRLFRLSVK